MVNLVIVSHSAQLGQGVGELARQMLMDDGCKIAIAAGIDDPQNPIGTDPIKVMEAIESVADADHVLVMMDIGSALLSAETALDLLDPAIAGKVRLCAAPLVEGTLAATVSAASGAGIEKVIDDAMSALEAKRVQLGLPSLSPTPSPAALPVPDGDAQSLSVVVKNPNGLHVRPASKLVAALAGFDADLVLEKDGKCVRPDSINQIALLQVRCNDTLRLLARGPDAHRALAAFDALAASHFGEEIVPGNDAPAATPQVGSVSGQAWTQVPHLTAPERQSCADPAREQQRLQQAIALTLADLNALTALAETKFSEDIAAIFSGHHTLLDDPELCDAACEVIRDQQCCAPWAWHQVLSALSQQYRELDDPYLQARYIDIDDILHRSLCYLQGTTPPSLADIPPSAILLADDIFPSTVLQLDAGRVNGICLRAGSALSHGAILARQSEIAWLCEMGAAVDGIRSGEPITLELAARRISRR
ncbi:dihydroxyacetone kinase phosphoryl donor subunit DhaM [[Enterobacter] lignolyticus]|uniref:phosphoenolpyruvate--glycerone phosphotransferase n=1 Tax=[Enterobacter] lignolyticus TaxID=1334193 RepID=A0A806X7P8_9ENTR|nr:dihydroxyacetone kinase phosphoryl donor subunit DhaM [[Enterobacter] lignolyticus]ALR75633.1 dihydroxyacetone kinase phosphotransferase subunit DhaM [[Enterobacter] lignolyticus]